MITLAWDTSGPSQGVALAIDGRVSSEVFESKTSSHSETLLPALKKVLEESALELRAVDRFALTVGPGSFTGLRIGISVLKAFCQVADRPVAPVSSLEALAEPIAREDIWIVPCLDARLRQVFTATYRSSRGTLDVKAPERVVPVDVFAEELRGLPGEKWLVGSGALAHRECWKEISGVVLPEEERRHLISAAAVLRVGERMFREGRAVHGRELEPRYLRASEAENRRRSLQEK
jgi:tRNA threonylcarbamoyladenosine biosynthesis protein TsaB